MQRLSTVILYVALLVFVVAASLALIAAAWLMAVHILTSLVSEMAVYQSNGNEF